MVPNIRDHFRLYFTLFPTNGSPRLFTENFLFDLFFTPHLQLLPIIFAAIKHSHSHIPITFIHSIINMPPKNDAAAETGDLIPNFSTKECKLLAAAFISSLATDKVSPALSLALLPVEWTDITQSILNLAASFSTNLNFDIRNMLTFKQYDYDLMSTLTGNTAGSLKKMWPPLKRKAIEHHASFGIFLGQVVGSGGASAANGEAKVATPAKATPAKATPGKKRKTAEDGADDAGNEKTASSPVKAKGRPKKQVKKEEPIPEEAASADDANEDSANGEDGQGSYIFCKRIPN